MSGNSDWGLGVPLTPELEEVRAEALALAAAIEPYAEEADEMSTIHPRVLDALRASGLARLAVPGEYGGRFERVNPVALCVAREIFMPISAHLDSLFTLQGLGTYSIYLAGSHELKQKWLPRVASMEALAALALTEQDAGSDLRNIQTRVVREPDGLFIDGQKTFISDAGSAHLYTTLVQDECELTLYVVDASSPGLSFSEPHELMAPHPIGDIRYDRVPVTEADRVGDPGCGLEYVVSTLGVFRASVGAAAVGLARRALEEAVRHTRTREQFGRPLARHGAVAEMLANSFTEVEASRQLVYRAATLAAEGHPNAVTFGAMAKLSATETASRVVDRCMQAMGRFGLVRGSVMERLYREARPMRVYEGTSEVIRLGIARTLVKDVP